MRKILSTRSGRINDGNGDRLYYLTSQWEKRISRVGFRGNTTRRTISWLNTDLWAVDATTAQPVFRKRLKKDKVNGDSVAIGVEQGILWARIPELAGIRLSDGVIVADSVFVLSRDRLGEEGRLLLARVAGPAGKPVWSTTLPLSNMSAWLPGEHRALMLGPDPSAQRSPMAEEGENPVMQIVSIDLRTGALNTFNPDLHRDWPAEEIPKPTP